MHFNVQCRLRKASIIPNTYLLSGMEDFIYSLCESKVLETQNALWGTVKCPSLKRRGKNLHEPPRNIPVLTHGVKYS